MKIKESLRLNLEVSYKLAPFQLETSLTKGKISNNINKNDNNSNNNNSNNTENNNNNDNEYNNDSKK